MAKWKATKGRRPVAASAALAGLLGAAWASGAEAGQGPASGTPPPAATSSYAGFTYAGPPAPVAPDVISRDGDGRAAVRAIRLSEPLKIDGLLDDGHYQAVPPFSGFIQIEPRDGDQATEQTEVWIAFDDDNFYVAFRCLDSQIDRLVANEMRRDNGNIFSGNDIVAFMLDPYYDRRNNVTFTINALGGRMDGQVTNEFQYNGDYNPVWNVKTGREAAAWTAEVAIPFKSLKYRAGRSQLWGFNVERVKRSKNEISFLTHVSKARGQQALRQASLAATIVGLEVPQRSRNLDIKPYATSNLTTDLRATPTISNDPGGDVGRVGGGGGVGREGLVEQQAGGLGPGHGLGRGREGGEVAALVVGEGPGGHGGGAGDGRRLGVARRSQGVDRERRRGGAAGVGV